MTERNPNLIVSLDDFGISREANANILQLLKTQKVDRVSIMMHGDFTQEEIKKLTDSRVKLDIHIDLKNKIDPKRKLRDGIVNRSCKFFFLYLTGKTNQKKISLEWENQIKNFQKTFGRTPDGISSHEHIHFFPPYFKAIATLAQKHQIGYLRFGKEAYKKDGLVSKIINWLRRKNLPSFRKTSLLSSDLMISFDWVNNLQILLDDINLQKKVEIIFHPERKEEMAFLKKFLS